MGDYSGGFPEAVGKADLDRLTQSFSILNWKHCKIGLPGQNTEKEHRCLRAAVQHMLHYPETVPHFMNNQGTIKISQFKG